MSTPETPWNTIDQSLRRMLNTARAAKGLSWEDVASMLRGRGWDISAGNLMTRHSRMAFRADEIVLLLDVLGVENVCVQALLGVASTGGSVR